MTSLNLKNTFQKNIFFKNKSNLLIKKHYFKQNSLNKYVKKIKKVTYFILKN